MKFAIVLTFLFLGQSFAAAPTHHFANKKLLHLSHSPQPTADYRLCGACIEFAEQFINQLLNIILNAGVVGGCAELCGMLPASNTEKEVCAILCDIVGIREFIKIIEEADLDPIYYCELLTVCEIKDDGDATITNLTVIPNKVVKGSTFEISFSFITKNGTGTGEMALEIRTQDGIPLGENTILKPVPAGQTVNGGGKVTAAPDPNCDPTQNMCEMWLPGNYSVILAVCNGECGSKHPHSQVYDEKTTDFNVVEN
ncbi:PREDICTED: countin-3-like [Amphimedon queenslandica]|uniref:Saposin B-type domain-containing protein n=1 Tax=Amphimedon queenslandica TaxID=400682 RepID=A0A1X7VN34_AMPQE|nr:PREDICTED: countin-3-like [Amphimedon queenslandica]|eukprot:XP_003383765.1 PREDICTED: countin-3-like [Amphimedon queenslandica]